MDEQQGEPASEPSTAPTSSRTRVVGAEVMVVLGLSLGQSAVYSIVSLTSKLTQGPLREATATLNPSLSPRPWLDLTYQILSIGFHLVPVLLGLYLLRPAGRVFGHRTIGFDAQRPWRDIAFGVGLAALIGIPGLGLYFAGRALGVTATVVPTALGEHWWTVGILVAAAVQNAVLEEVLVVGYLITRLRELRWPLAWIIACSAVLRGSYHLYQGFGPFVANAIMGVIFALFYLRTRRVMPLVIAHTLLDVVAFVGYAAFGDALGLA